MQLFLLIRAIFRKDDAREISGLDDHAFEEAYEKASNIADKFMDAEGKKMDKFMELLAKRLKILKGFQLVVFCMTPFSTPETRHLNAEFKT